MRIKLKIQIFSLIILSFYGCNSQQKNNSDCVKYEGIILNGLYHFELVDDIEDISDTYVYIFEGNMQYKLYPKSAESISYETPTHYYIADDKFYSCGVSLQSTNGIVSLKDCKKGDYKYEILSMENTVDRFNSKIHQIKMKSKYGNRMVILKKFI